MSILVWALMETSPKTRIQIQVVYLGGETKKCRGRSSEWDGAGRVHFKQVATVVNCSIFSLWDAEKPRRTRTSEASHLRERELEYLHAYCQLRAFLRVFVCISSVHFCHSVISNSLWPTVCSTPSPTPGAYSNSSQTSWLCHPIISSSVVPFSSCLQSFPASGSFPMSQFFPSGGQSIRVSASASVLPVNIQDWFPSGLTGWISL